MQKNIHKNLLQRIKSQSILAVAAGLFLVSCGAQMGGYSETDGVYYDPNKDTLPEGYVNNEGNRVGDYYNYQDSLSVFDKSRANQKLKNDRYNHWNRGNNDSDWGVYTGTEANYHSDYGWGYPYGYGNNFGYGWGSSFGMYGGYNSLWDLGFSNWGYGYSPFYGYYSPYYGYYSPYGYAPYYGNYYAPYYGNYYGPYYNNKRSGVSGGGFRDTNRQPVNRTYTPNAGFRNEGNVRRNPDQNIYRDNNVQQPRYRTQPQQPTNQAPRRESQPAQQPRYRNDDSGMRSGSDGGFQSGGSYNSGSSNNDSGSTRSGGGFRTGGR